MTWRDKYKVHPAADVFPMMSDAELDDLGQNIKENGLQVPILFWRGQLIDGRNRLEAMERTKGFDVPEFIGTAIPDKADPVAVIIGLNIRRRHLTKQQQADLIVATIKASRQVGEVPKQRHVKGKPGSDKDPTKAAAVATGNEHGIGKRTVERAFAKAEGRKPKPWGEQVEEELLKRKQTTQEKHKATLEANRKARRERLAEDHPEIAKDFGIPVADTSSWQRLAKVLVRLGSDHEGERQNAADTANKILQPFGWQLVRAPR